MITVAYGIFLFISILVILYMLKQDYEDVDIHYFMIVMMIPVVLLGYWLKTMVTTAEGARIAFCFIYFDSTLMLAIMLFSILKFIGVAVKSWIKVLVYAVSFAHLTIIWVNINNKLYYDSITLIDTGIGTATKMTSGPLKIFHWIYLAAMLLGIVAAIVFAYIKRGTYSRKTLLLFTLLLISGLFIYGVETVIDIDFSTLPFLYTVVDVVIAFNYDNVHTHDINYLISEQQKHYGTRGYVSFDTEGRYLSANQVIFELLPGMSSEIVDEKLDNGSEQASLFYGIIDDYKRRGITFKNVDLNDKIYRFEISEFYTKKGGYSQGYLFDIRDITEEQKVINLIKDYNDTLNKEVGQKTENIKSIQEKVVLGLANMVENRDNNTGGHVKRTSDVIKYLVKEVRAQGIYDMDEQLANDIVRAAPMHDLGKITIDNHILNKPGRLTKEEYDIMKTHSEKSAEIVQIILKDVEEQHFVNVAYNVARYHHERWDGKGYPEGIVGEMIPLEARIMAVADVYDALVSKRCYKEPMSFEQAADIMVEGMGGQFDPNMLSVFLACREDLEKYYTKIK
ncbi:MAG: HD domain-containing protein [Lachnospiraceae bacterium]|nr:HD domain-containing protein [Lachnospiraceae bacterium]